MTQAVLSSAIMIITALVGFATNKAVAYLNKRGIIADLENKREVVNIVVNATEQIWKVQDGAAKLKNAQDLIVDMLHEKGIRISQDELSMLIEDSVKHMNDALKGVDKK